MDFKELDALDKAWADYRVENAVRTIDLGATFKAFRAGWYGAYERHTGKTD